MKLQKNTLKLLIFDADETLWTFPNAQHLVWASVTHPPYIIKGRDLLVDSKGIQIKLLPYVHETIDLAKKLGFALSMASNNDFHSAQAILEHFGLFDKFKYPQIDWQSKDLQIKNIYEAFGLEPSKAQQQRTIFVDDKIKNINAVKKRFPHLITIHLREKTLKPVYNLLKDKFSEYK